MRTRTPTVFVAFLTTVSASFVAAGVMSGPAEAVSTNQSYWVPVSKQLVVRGHGYGHGHGMSQYGAQGAALQGKTYKEIVDFYYPGTSWSKVRGNVRVLIGADTSTDVVVSPTDGLAVRDLGTGKTYVLPEITDVRRWRLNVDQDRTVVGYLTSRWHRYRLGGNATLAGDGEFSASGPITLWTPGGPKRYRGTLRAATPPGSSSARDTVNVLSMDGYVKGVVPYEMPASWDPAAVRAQAVAARTYATWSRNQNKRRYYQICDTTACQVYGGASGEDPRSNNAVTATARQILTYGGNPAFTQFSSSSGGWTSAGSVPYLTAKPDPYDDWSGNPVHDWSTTIDAGRLERSYPSIGVLRRLVVVNRDGNGEWRGRVNSLVLDGTRDDVTISGDQLRWAFGLRSTWFTFDPTPIMARWASLGGRKSQLGMVKTREYRVDNGSLQVFEGGRIFHSPATGARELYGPILRAYRGIGGTGSVLRMPRTGVQKKLTGQRAKFQNGVIYTNPATGTVVLHGAIAVRYLDYGGVRSALGWPTVGNTVVDGGERAMFEHGSITWTKSDGRTQVNLDG